MPVRPWKVLIGQGPGPFVRASGISERKEGGDSYLSGVDVAVVNAGDDISLVGNVDALGVGLSNGVRIAPGDVGEVLHLLGADLFTILCQLAAPSRMRSPGIAVKGTRAWMVGITWPHSWKWRGNSVP